MGVTEETGQEVREKAQVLKMADSYEGHPGEHFVTMDACEPEGQLLWNG